MSSRLRSTTTDQDIVDHPYIYATLNTTFWLLMFFFVALPFGIMSSILVVIIRPFTVMFPESDIYELTDFLELCQFMPEICMASLLAKADFVRALDSRRVIHFGTPV